MKLIKLENTIIRVSTKDVLIKGDYDLILKVGNKYNISYGIHQGVF